MQLAISHYNLKLMSIQHRVAASNYINKDLMVQMLKCKMIQNVHTVQDQRKAQSISLLGQILISQRKRKVQAP